MLKIVQGQLAGATGKNTAPNAFPCARANCNVTGHNCEWRGASGMIADSVYRQTATKSLYLKL
ncbi:hypothetical protein BM1_04833 [Bipolaris maydis]|nr:hypothetical protein BM1_04833 [Bipolaris maydis]